MQLFGPYGLPGQLAVAALPGIAENEGIAGQLAAPPEVDPADTATGGGADVDGETVIDADADDSHGAAVGSDPVVGELDPDKVRRRYGHVYSSET
jgi:hypothetical protein